MIFVYQDIVSTTSAITWMEARRETLGEVLLFVLMCRFLLYSAITSWGCNFGYIGDFF